MSKPPDSDSNKRGAHDEGDSIKNSGEAPPKRCFLVTIAISKYENEGVVNLDNPVPDAERLIESLTQEYMFQGPIESVEKIEEIKRDIQAGGAGNKYEKGLCIKVHNESAIIKNINKTLDLIFEMIKGEDDLLIFYAGHSYKGESKDPIQSTYWALYNSDIPDKEKDDNYPTYYNYGSLVNKINKISEKCRNILLINDTCFGARVLHAGDRSGEGDAAEYAYCYRAITSGAPYQTVSDGKKGKGSPFIEQLINALKISYNENVSSEKLFNTIKPKLEEVGQISEYGPLLLTKKGRGHFRLYLKNQVDVKLPNHIEITRMLVSDLDFKEQASLFEDDEKGFYHKEHFFNFLVLAGVPENGHMMLLKKILPAKLMNRLDYSIIRILLDNSENGHVTNPTVWKSLSVQLKNSINGNIIPVTSDDLSIWPSSLTEALLHGIKDKNLLIIFEVNNHLLNEPEGIESQVITFWEGFNSKLKEYNDLDENSVPQRLFFVVFDYRGEEANKAWKRLETKLRSQIHQNSKLFLFPPFKNLDERIWSNWVQKLDPDLRNPIENKFDNNCCRIKPAVKKICLEYGFGRRTDIDPYHIIFETDNFSFK